MKLQSQGGDQILWGVECSAAEREGECMDTRYGEIGVSFDFSY